MLLLLTVITAWSFAMGSVPQYSMEHAEDLFELFIRDHNRNYTDDKEKQSKIQIFKQNLEKVIQRNMERGENYAVFGITKFMDMTVDEFQSKSTGLRYTEAAADNNKLCTLLNDKDIKEVTAPEAYDWRAHNAVTEVKYQGFCLGCWAFSAVGNIEAQYAIKHKVLMQFSEQQLLDCDPVSHGCASGYMAAGFRELIKEGGSESEKDYPFTSIIFSDKCVKAEALQSYDKGIVTAKQCDCGKINHAVLVVGYGEENGMPFWILKNSWGTDWGEQGYYRMERREGLNTCEMLNDFMATSVVV